MKKLRLSGLIAMSVLAADAGISLAQTSTEPAPASTSGDMQPAAGPDADNSRTNRRDRGDHRATPMEQPEDSNDVKMESAVRRAIVNDHSLSTDAHNIKIIARKGVVTLRGPVRDAAEQQTVISLAGQVPGVMQVQNQLDVEHP